MRRRVRHALEARDAGHIHDVCLSLALDQVDAVQVDTERSATAQRDVGLLGRRRERLAVFLRLRAGRKDLPDAEEPLADHVDPPVARIRAAITLSRSATVTGYGFTMAAPWACRAPAMLIGMPEICFSTYRSCSTRTLERSMRRPLPAMTSTTTPMSASACMVFGKMLTWPAP